LPRAVSVSAKPPRHSRRGPEREVRRMRIFARLQEGWSYEEIGRQEGVTRERIRQIVKQALVKREVDATHDHALLQLARLAPALRLAAEAVGEARSRRSRRCLRCWSGSTNTKGRARRSKLRTTRRAGAKSCCTGSTSWPNGCCRRERPRLGRRRRRQSMEMTIALRSTSPQSRRATPSRRPVGAGMAPPRHDPALPGTRASPLASAARDGRSTGAASVRGASLQWRGPPRPRQAARDGRSTCAASVRGRVSPVARASAPASKRPGTAAPRAPRQKKVVDGRDKSDHDKPSE